jgi:SAM-dependent methyltransferase
MTLRLEPLSVFWGEDRGLPVVRYYAERFLEQHASRVRGRCLEFQEDKYTTRLGGEAVSSLDILHVDASNPRATIVADLTQPNDVRSDSFDCVVCTFVLHVIQDVERCVRELRRILAPGGTLLVAVPHISMCDQRYGEIWRFTPEGLARILGDVFGEEGVEVSAYGNSLVSAGQLRGLVTDEFTPAELDHHDPRFALIVCAAATKPMSPPTR